jgi:hypothetical protein
MIFWRTATPGCSQAAAGVTQGEWDITVKGKLKFLLTFFAKEQVMEGSNGVFSGEFAAGATTIFNVSSPLLPKSPIVHQLLS